MKPAPKLKEVERTPSLMNTAYQQCIQVSFIQCSISGGESWYTPPPRLNFPPPSFATYVLDIAFQCVIVLPCVLLGKTVISLCLGYPVKFLICFRHADVWTIRYKIMLFEHTSYIILMVGPHSILRKLHTVCVCVCVYVHEEVNLLMQMLPHLESSNPILWIVKQQHWTFMFTESEMHHC